MSDLHSFIAQNQSRISGYLDQVLSTEQLSPYANTSNNQLLAAMRYSLLDGGKRIRPTLAYAAAHALAAPNSATDAYAAAVECIHAYSLVHDDLPAMDDDDLRRGKATCHIAFDEATAILAGDGLHCLAFELIAAAEIDASNAILALRTLSGASGAKGMVLGQAIDLASVDKTPSLEQLQSMHRHKTGALIKAAVLLGAISVDATQTQLQALADYSDAIGLAFQVQDDILDVTADTATLGKAQGADIEKNKPTYVSLLGLEGARAKTEDLLQQALDSLTMFGQKADYLRDIARYIVTRRY
ncbi:geranylgeranyl diphosphate synthase, type II [Alteromonadaceae bacterium Bs31]|nr:geranylgeranyl diphosphate synthase, type II [Alteromonadaceae bacterium Bs31]